MEKGENQDRKTKRRKLKIKTLNHAPISPTFSVITTFWTAFSSKKTELIYFWFMKLKRKLSPIDT